MSARFLLSLSLALSVCGNSRLEDAGPGQTCSRGDGYSGVGCPSILFPVSDMEVMCVQEHCCDPAQPVEKNCSNWVVRQELALGVTAETKGTGSRHMASYAPSQP